MAKFKMMEMKTIGSILSFSAKLTTKGPNKTPKTVNIWIRAAAIDCTSTVKVYVCMQASKVEAMSKRLFNGILEATFDIPSTNDVRSKLLLILGTSKVSPNNTSIVKKTANPHFLGILWIM